jgi:hypothetical protein
MVDGDPTPSSSDETVEGTIEGAEDRIQFLKWWEVSEREREREIIACLDCILNSSAIGRMPPKGIGRVRSDGAGGIVNCHHDPNVRVTLIEAPCIFLFQC